MKKILAITLTLLLCICLFSCNTPENTDVWSTATYTDDIEIGQGEKTVAVLVTAEEKTVTLTVKTNENTLGNALLTLDLINNKGGLFDTVIGIKADFSKNEAWWKFCDAEGNALMYGVFDAEINDGEIFKFVYTIGF